MGKSGSVPGPSGLPVVGNTHQWIRDPCGFKERAARQYGRVVNFDIIGTDTYMLTDPADIERVLAERGIYEAVENMKGPFEPQNQPVTFLAPDWMPVPFLRRSRAARDHLRSEFYDIIEQRRTTGEDRDDFLSMMLEADHEMSDELICDEMMTFLMAGHDTTALTMTFVLDQLSRNPGVAKRLRDELDGVLDGEPGFDDLPELSYTEKIVKETMRLYPAAHEVRREPVRDVYFGDYRVPEGALILLSA